MTSSRDIQENLDFYKTNNKIIFNSKTFDFSQRCSNCVSYYNAIKRGCAGGILDLHEHNFPFLEEDLETCLVFLDLETFMLLLHLKCPYNNKKIKKIVNKCINTNNDIIKNIREKKINAFLSTTKYIESPTHILSHLDHNTFKGLLDIIFKD